MNPNVIIYILQCLDKCLVPVYIYQLSLGQKVECRLISSESRSIGRNQNFLRSPMCSAGSGSLLLLLCLPGDKEGEGEKGKSIRLSY